MFTNLRKNVLVPIAALASLALMPAPASADGGDYLLPVVATIGEFNLEQDDGITAPGECAEARDAAWFQHEMERSDGEVSPAAPRVEACERLIFAASDD